MISNRPLLHIMHWFKFVLFLLTVLLSSNILALSTDREQPLKIESDKATIDHAKGIAIYEGNVIITQGSIRINASVVTINYTQSIEKVVADGKSAQFKQRLDQGDDIKAKAKQMEYNALENMLYLRNNAELRKVRRGKNVSISKAPRIVYDTQRGIIKADQGKTKSGRTTVIIYPQSSSKK